MEHAMNAFNFNWKVTIYPNELGWKKILEITQDRYRITEFAAMLWVDRRRSNDGGYTDQLWSIASELHEMFYNGQNYLANTTVTLHPE